MPTKKKPVKTRAVEPVVVEIEVKTLRDWVSEAIPVVKVYRAGAISGVQRVALDELLVRLRAVLSECGVK